MTNRYCESCLQPNTACGRNRKIICIFWVLAQYFTQPTIFPLFLLFLAVVNCVLELSGGHRTRIEGTGCAVTKSSHVIGMMASCGGTKPWERVQGETTATAHLSTVLHCQLQGQIHSRMGCDWLGRKEEAEAHPAWWSYCKSSRSLTVSVLFFIIRLTSTVLTNEVMVFFIKITRMSLLVHNKQCGFIVNYIHSIIFFHS